MERAIALSIADSKVNTLTKKCSLGHGWGGLVPRLDPEFRAGIAAVKFFRDCLVLRLKMCLGLVVESGD